MRGPCLVNLCGVALFGLLAITISGCAPETPAPSVLQTQLDARVEAAIESEEIARGLAIVVIGPTADETFSAAAGVADPDGRAFTPATPLRIASITKTFTAATILSLWEDGRLDLDGAISGLIDPEYDAMLRSDGYDTAAITVRHLLMHTAGLPDHADAAYVEIVMGDPSRFWSRRDQVALAVDTHDPLGPPDGQYSYSDTGYILLGDIIERLTGETLAAAVRDYLKFDALGLTATWWEQVEVRPGGSAPRAHQYLGDINATGWNGSIDLYGGGGLLMSPMDLARFMAALMRGDIFDDPATLEAMMTAPGHPFPDQYRIGLFPRDSSGYDAWSHEGFWGTHAILIPELEIAVAAAVLDQSGYGKMRVLVNETIDDVIANR